MQTINLKVTKKCAFCKHWYDPANSAIQPKVPVHNLWQYEEKAANLCRKKNMEKKASAFCGDYVCKVDIQ